jgi:hypothetical protein
MSTEDRLAALEESLQLVIQGVRALHEHQRVVEESFRQIITRLVEHQAETDEVVNRILRHLMTQSENGNQQ